MIFRSRTAAGSGTSQSVFPMNAFSRDSLEGLGNRSLGIADILSEGLNEHQQTRVWIDERKTPELWISTDHLFYVTSMKTGAVGRRFSVSTYSTFFYVTMIAMVRGVRQMLER